MNLWTQSQIFLKSGWTSFENVLERGTNLVTVGVIFIMILIASMATLHGGGIGAETNAYIPYHLSQVPVLNQLFDSKVLDMDMYQARELSYLVDWLDVQVIALGVAIGLPHFLALSSYVMVFLMAAMFYRFCVKDLELRKFTAAFLSVFFLTSPCAFFGGIYFRSAKDGVAVLILWIAIALFRFLRSNKSELSASDWMRFFLATLAMTMFDRQGFYFACAILLFLLIWKRASPKIFSNHLFVPFLASILISLIYNYVLAPEMTLMLNGYWPNFAYQQIPIRELLSSPLNYLSTGASLFVDTFRLLFGDVPGWLAGMAILCWIIFFLVPKNSVCRLLTLGRFRSRKVIQINYAGIVLGGMILIIVTMNVLMLVRHPALTLPDLHSIYYWLPAVILIVFGSALGIQMMIRRASVPQWIVNTVLAALIVGNVFAIPVHMHEIVNGISKESWEYSPRLIEVLKCVGTPVPVADDIATNAVYLALEKTPKWASIEKCSLNLAGAQNISH